MEQWIQVLNQYGALTFLIFSPIAYLTHKLVNNDVISAVREKIIDKISNETKLSDHPIYYSKLKYIKMIDSINFDDYSKTQIFRNIFNIKYKVILEESTILQGYTDEQIEKLDWSEFITNIIYKYEEEIQQYLIKTYSKVTNDRVDGLQIYELIYSKRIKAYILENETLVSLMIESIKISDIPPKTKAYLVLNAVLSTLDISLLNIEKTFKELNGGLTNITKKYN